MMREEGRIWYNAAMKNTKAILAAALVASAMAARQATADAVAERQAFVRSNGAAFSGSVLKSSEEVKASDDFMRAPGTTTWTFALPVAEDSRLRFIEATFSGGKFSRGELKSFGNKPEKLTAKAFAELREQFPMVASRRGNDRASVIYPAKRTPTRVKTPAHPQTISHDAAAQLIGAAFLQAIRGQLGVNVGELHFDVVFEGPGGFSCVLGRDRVSEKAAADALRAAIETRWPKHKGMVSDRDVADAYASGHVVYRPAGAKPPAKRR